MKSALSEAALGVELRIFTDRPAHERRSYIRPLRFQERGGGFLEDTFRV